MRLYQVFGRHQKFDRLIPYIIKCALDGKNFNSTEGKQIRDFLFIDDLNDDSFIELYSRRKMYLTK